MRKLDAAAGVIRAALITAAIWTVIILAAATAAPVPAPVRQVDINEAGRVLATLNDWRSIMFAELIIIGVMALMVTALIGVIVWLAGRRSANDQATLDALTLNTRAAADHAAALRAVEVAVARVEAEMPGPRT